MSQLNDHTIDPSDDGRPYYIRIEGDRHRAVDGDICDLIEERYNVRAELVTEPIETPRY